MKLSEAIDKLQEAGVAEVADRRNMIHSLEEISRMSKEVDESRIFLCKETGKKCRIIPSDSIDLARTESGGWEILDHSTPHLPPLLRQVS